MKICGILQTQNYRRTCHTFETLKRLTDCTIVLDDNSTQPFPHADVVYDADVVLTQRRAGPWNCTANLTMLFYQAFVMGCEWIMRLDDDMMLGDDHQTYAETLRRCRVAQQQGCDIVNYRRRDLWNDYEHYRDDGEWRIKCFPVLCRNWFFDKRITMQDPKARLHQTIWPAIGLPPLLLPLGSAVYHVGSMTPAARRARVEKYAKEDAGNEFQPAYKYIADETGLTLARVPEADLKVFPMFTSD